MGNDATRHQTAEIPLAKYTFPEVTSAEIYRILNKSEPLLEESASTLLMDVACEVAKEPKMRMKNCEISVFFHKRTNDPKRATQIVLKAGEGRHRFVCLKNSDGVTCWEKQEYWNEEKGIPTENYTCDIITCEEINKILSKSQFLGEAPHRNFFSSKVRTAVNEEFKMVRKNCTLTIELEALEGSTRIPMKYIIIKAGKGENKIRSAKDTPWELEEKTKWVGICRALSNSLKLIYAVVTHSVFLAIPGSAKVPTLK